MADLIKLFQSQYAYVDEDGFLSFNPKHEKAVGAVCVTNLELNQDYIDVTSFQDEDAKYIAGYQSPTVRLEINLMPDVLNELDNYEKQPKKPQKPEVKKDIIQGPFAFLNIKED